MKFKKLKTGGGLQAYMHSIEKNDKILSSNYAQC